MKRCTKCKQNKPRTEFFKSRAEKDGLKFTCKECDREAKNAQRDKADPQRIARRRIKELRKVERQAERMLAELRNAERNAKQAINALCRSVWPEYDRLKGTLAKMIARCSNERDKWYRCYGGKGVAVCDEWANDAVAFVDWCYRNGYERGLTIDRIDNDGNYEPGNCRWCTMRVNNRNRGYVKLDESKVRAIKKLRGNGMKYREIAEVFGVSMTCAQQAVKGVYWSDV